MHRSESLRCNIQDATTRTRTRGALLKEMSTKRGTAGFQVSNCANNRGDCLRCRITGFTWEIFAIYLGNLFSVNKIAEQFRAR